MATKLPGARRALDYMEADLREMLAHSHEPRLVEKLAAACLRILSEDFDPLLNRAAPSVEQRLDELAQRIEVLEAASKVIQFRKEA